MAGLPWIKVSVDLPRHPKSQRLAARLDDPKAWIYVVQLWAWIAEYEATGEVQGEDAALLVARGAGWAGDPDTFCRAMISAGFLDTTPDGLAIHDWEEWAGAHVEKKAKDAKRQAKKRAGDAASRGPSTPSHADVRVTEEGRHAESRAESATQRVESRDGRSEAAAAPAALPAPPRLPTREERLAARWPLATHLAASCAEAWKLPVSLPRTDTDRALVEEAARKLGNEPALQVCLDDVDDAIDGGRLDGPPESLGWCVKALQRALTAPPAPPKRGPRENPRPGDPDFNDMDAWPDYEAYLRRDAGAGGARG